MEQEIKEETLPFILKASAKNALMVGLFAIILTMVSYAMDPALLAKWWLGILFYIISVGLTIYYAIDTRKKIGGYMDFKQAVLTLMTTFLISSFITQIFSYLLFTVIDPGLTELLKQTVLEQTTSMMERFGAPQEEIDKALAQIETQDYGMSLGRAAKGYLFGGLFNIIVSMAVALGVKKNKPVFETE